MFQGFNIKNLQIEKIKDYQVSHDVGRELYANICTNIEKKISFMKDKNCILDARKIQEDWFPEIKADVFISHSHADIDLAIAFAGWLKGNFGITSFIDYCLWGYCDELLKIIDNNFCKNSNGETYNYKTRNASTSIVHMMLMNAITKMIDRTECLMFLNTPNSIIFKDDISDKTYSPWIFSELETSRIIRKIIPVRLKDRLSKQTKCFSTLNESQLKIAFPVNMSHLIELNCQDLKTWWDGTQRIRYFNTSIIATKSLNILYKTKGLIN